MASLAKGSLTTAQARTLTEKIRRSAKALVDDTMAAWEGRAWEALGYESWAVYCAAEFGGLNIPAAERKRIVGIMRGAGMSTRAIGAATNTSDATVRRDLAEAGATNDAPVTGTDGKMYPAQRTVVAGEVVTSEDQAAYEAENARLEAEAGAQLEAEQREVFSDAGKFGQLKTQLGHTLSSVCFVDRSEDQGRELAEVMREYADKLDPPTDETYTKHFITQTANSVERFAGMSGHEDCRALRSALEKPLARLEARSGIVPETCKPGAEDIEQWAAAVKALKADDVTGDRYDALKHLKGAAGERMRMADSWR